MIFYNISWNVVLQINTVIAIFAYNNFTYISLICFFPMWAVILLISWLLTFDNTRETGKFYPIIGFFKLIMLSGVRKIARHMTLLSDPGKKQTKFTKCWKMAFELWWGFSIKYFMPVAITYLLWQSLKLDTDKPYGDYPEGTNWVGWVVVIISVLILIIPCFVCCKKEPFEFDVDQPFDTMSHKVDDAQDKRATVGDEDENQKKEEEEEEKADEDEKSGLKDESKAEGEAINADKA